MFCYYVRITNVYLNSSPTHEWDGQISDDPAVTIEVMDCDPLILSLLCHHTS